MENYIVSARKYRPSTFRSVVGQDALTTTLKNAISSNKLAHAYLFCGPRGVGKTTCARIFAKTINCQNRTGENEACNVCESCQSFNDQRSYSIHELDAASNNGVDDIRTLTEQVRIPPQTGRYSVYIIDEVHMLSQGAFNAFLKTLEEPPKHAIFILATTEKHKIIPTILSRCQIYDFNRISIKDTVAHLKYVASQENVTIEDSALNVIARKSDGGMRDALSIFDQLVSYSGNNITYQSTVENLNVLDYEYYFQLVDAMLAGGVSQSLLLFNEVLNKGFDAHHFIGGLSSHFRDILISKDAATIQLLEVSDSIGEKYKQQAISCPTEFLYTALAITNECDLNYRLSKNKRLLVEITLIKICQLTGNKKITTTTQVSLQTANNEQKGKGEIAQKAPEVKKEEKIEAKTDETEPKAVEEPTNQSTVLPKSISISSFQEKTEDPVVVSNPIATFTKENPFTNEDLVEKWKNFASTQNLDKGTKSFLDTHLPSLVENNLILIKIDNIFQEKEIHQLNILAYLREQLGNDTIKLIIEQIPESEQPKRRSQAEIFQEMINEFPSIQKLSIDLEMEPDVD